MNELERIELETVLAEELVQIRYNETLPGTVLAATFGVGQGSALLADRDARADQGAVGLTRYPPALAAALEKIETKGSTVEGQPSYMAHLLARRPQRGGRRWPGAAAIAGTDRGPARAVTFTTGRYTMRSKLRALAAGTTAVVVLGGCSSHHRAAILAPTTSTSIATTTTVAPTTTTAKPVPLAPLTGLPQSDIAYVRRPAVVVKIDNVDAARPQTGINQSDIVYEEMVEGGLTRLAAIFQSQYHAGGWTREIGPADR